MGGVRVDVVEAVHDGRRWPVGKAIPALGFVLRGSRSIYFAGDTDLFDGMAALAPLDVALVPVAGWGPKVGPGHMDPRGAAEALALLRPSIAVPIHWGTYGIVLRGVRGDRTPAEQFAREAAAVAPDVEVRILSEGGSFELDAMSRDRRTGRPAPTCIRPTSHVHGSCSGTVREAASARATSSRRPRQRTPSAWASRSSSSRIASPDAAPPRRPASSTPPGSPSSTSYGSTLLEGLPLVVGGRSSGARVACRTAAATDAAGVLCLAFPLRPPRRKQGPEPPSRLDELDAVTVPVLVVQGARDPFGIPPAGPTRAVVEVSADHSLRTDLETVRAAIGGWLRDVVR